MRLSVFGVYAIGFVGVCRALPIQSVAAGDRNIILLGAFVFLTFGAVLAGCVCCRRRKKGFEEFRNESGTPEGNKTEYPIFRALSPESPRNVPLAAAAVNNSNENLIEDEDFDNNNGPISPADLENIENNNAVDYIQNQNEVGIAIEPLVHSVNRNLANSSNIEPTQHEPEIQDVAISSTNHFPLPISVVTPELHLESVVLPEVKENVRAVKDTDCNNFVSDKIQLETFHTTTERLPAQDELQISYIDSVNLDETIKSNLVRKSSNVDSSAVINIENCTYEEDLIERDEKIDLETTTSDEASSIKSGLSEKSGEISSVEEALRALDCAIAGENCLNSGCEDDDDDLNYEAFECNDTNFQKVIRQLLINNGVKSILPDLTEDPVNINLISNNVNNLECIQTEAELLVDSILNESQKIVAERWNSRDNKSYPTCNTSKVVADCTVNTNCLEPFHPNANNNVNEKSEPYTNSPLLTPCESIEDFFSYKSLAKTSTPCIQNKFTSQIEFESVPNPPVPGSRKKLIEYNENVFTSPVESSQVHNIALDKTVILDTTYVSPNAENNTFTFPESEKIAGSQTFEVDRTFYVCPAETNEDANKEFIHPCDPCTSKQALERDCGGGYPSIVYDREEMNSEDMTTITPVNTPIELNYSNETWSRMTKNSNPNVDRSRQDTTDENSFESSGWFLHPQTTTNMHENETFDVEDDEVNLELTFEALRKQLAEVLPQSQGISGPPEYSNDEDDAQQNRSPLGLIDGDPTPSAAVQNELFINYKRALTPILEESEEETCKTFVMNETKCLDSTSTGCVDTGEAIMGVTKTLMASNDTLFNFEDTLGEREDVFSPRTPSRSDMPTNISIKSGKSTEENSVATLESEKFDSNDSEQSTEQVEQAMPGKRIPPKTIDIVTTFNLVNDNDLCSPEQQKTFSEGTNSSTTDRVSSDISGTVDHDTTFTTNTNDERTCVTVIVKDDERISEISEPEWGSTASYGGYEMNSLTDVPSLDYNVNIEAKFENDDISRESVPNLLTLKGITCIIPTIRSTDTDDNGQEDSGNSTHASADDRTTNSDNTSDGETHKCDDDEKISDSHLICQQQQQQSPSKNLQINLDDREKCRNFLLNEIENSSSQNAQTKSETNKLNNYLSENGDVDCSKENKNPNIKVLLSHLNDFDQISYQKVQTNSQDTVIVDKSKNNSSDLCEKDLKNGVHENLFYQPEITKIPNKHQQTIISYSQLENEQDCLMVADEIIGHLSGEEDPWAEPLNDLHFTGPCSEIISTSFTINEWDSDVDDSHSSEEFMYVRGTSINNEISDGKNQSNEIANVNDGDNEKKFPEFEKQVFESDIWSSHEDKIPVADLAEDELSDGSLSEFEGEFIPSCWDSMATPARSALKSPDKSSSQHNKNRNVVFKKQRYHSVYEYPRENSSLSPAYSEPYLYSRDFAPGDSKEEFSDGFTVSSTMRPFHGSQFNALCHTWPTDSDFSWSQVEDLGDIVDEKKLATYSNTDIKWPQNFDSIDLEDDETKIDNSDYYGNHRNESAEMLIGSVPLGELCHTKSTLRLPLKLLPPVDSITADPRPKSKVSDIFIDRLILPTPSCTGSMDSISSSSGSDRQISFSTFGKYNNSSFVENGKRPNLDITTTNVHNEHLKPALILIENEPIEFSFRSDKIKQSDSTDEDSGIESIMKIK